MEYRFQHTSTLEEVCEGSAVLRTYFYSGANRSKYFIIAIIPILFLSIFSTIVGIFSFKWVANNLFYLPMPTLLGALFGLFFSLWAYGKFIAPPLNRRINAMGKKDANLKDVDQTFIFNDDGMRINSGKGYSVSPWSDIDAAVVSKDYIFILQGFMGYPIPRSVIGETSAQENFLEYLKTKIGKVVDL